MRAVTAAHRPGRHRSGGQALVEFSLAAVLLVTLVVGSAQVALVYYDQMSVSSGAREAAVVAVENPTNTGLFSTPNSPASPGAHTCSGPSDPILACAAAYDSTHSGLFGGLITISALSVTLTGATYPGITAGACPGGVGTSDGLVTVVVTYNAPIFVPFVGGVLATPGQAYRTVTSHVTTRVEPCDVTSGA